MLLSGCRKSLKSENLSKIERSEHEKFSAQLAACLLLKGLAGARGRGQRLAAAAPNARERFAQHKNRVYRQAERSIALLCSSLTFSDSKNLRLF